MIGQQKSFGGDKLPSTATNDDNGILETWPIRVVNVFGPEGKTFGAHFSKR